MYLLTINGDKIQDPSIKKIQKELDKLQYCENQDNCSISLCNNDNWNLSYHGKGFLLMYKMSAKNGDGNDLFKAEGVAKTKFLEQYNLFKAKAYNEIKRNFASPGRF